MGDSSVYGAILLIVNNYFILVDKFLWFMVFVSILIPKIMVIKEWSCGEFKGSFGEINIEPEIQAEGAYSIELKCSPSILNHAVDRINTFSITDQILFLLALSILYCLISFLLS